MTRAYQGLTDKGEWQQFEWEGDKAPTLEETGYEEIEEIVY